MRQGEIHALLGENGAGKSTLCSILAGLYQADRGEIEVGGTPCRFRSPSDALGAGVGMVYQHFRLVDRLTVAENIALGDRRLGLLLKRKPLERMTRELMERHGLVVDPSATVGSLSVGEQQRVEILKLLRREVRVLILDEPTAVLTPTETRGLFDAMRSLASAGRAVVFISHKLAEVLAASDRVTVLRDGRAVATVTTADAQRTQLARLMVGRELADQVEAPTGAAGGAERHPEVPVLQIGGLRVADDRGHDAVRGVELDVHEGEIVGLAGVAGNGQRELAEAVAGMRAGTGSVRLGDEDLSGCTARERSSKGLAFVPEDRLGTGVARGLPLADNLVLRGYRTPRFSSGPFLRRREIAREVEKRTRALDIRGGRPGMPIAALSGGNVQRAILARELATDPRVLIAACPTRGLDVGAAALVHKLLRAERSRGAGVLLISEDLDELLELSDRLLVIYEGEIIGGMPRASAQRERLGLLMAGSRGPE